ncbi:hypothetical protein PHLGIDRAFT_18868 [Phlebiopsis gigantea 11061_1 CR5-6]|uniref:Protein kinase domain-containing protein n=1 Tax=Phlebiopsis gigantea (strain 11061_1 CR5-6) TaxID=745531 RepID=A0A0C3NTT4_PHLG1|nr:hypothetical protein PHLGIDRAFT_18868 [Phlebiopsis gigantea 11061_1 CR5-6]
MTPSPNRLPYYRSCTPEEAARYAENTQYGHYDLLPSEIPWRDRQPFLQSQGYLLRPRYNPNWTPSWLGTLRHPQDCEDSIWPKTLNNVLDATHQSDGHRVSIKVVPKNTQEIEIGRLLTGHTLEQDPRNHCVPILDVFPDPVDTTKALIVSPYLTPFNDPEYTTLGEVLDLIQQTLEGIDFMHSQGVAHGGCTAANIMMDSNRLYPRGHHPVRRELTMDVANDSGHLPRSDIPVKYYLVNYSMSTRFVEGQKPLFTGTEGHEQTPLESGAEQQRNAYKLDIYTLGRLYHEKFIGVYEGMEFLMPLIEAMLDNGLAHCTPSARALEIFGALIAEANLSAPRLRCKLRRRSESAPVRLIWGTVAMAKEGLSQAMRLAGL